MPDRDPHTAIRLHIQNSVMTVGLFAPKITFNGHPIWIAPQGVHTIPVPPGVHQIHAEAQWLRTYGQADLTATVAPGQSVDVYYAPPMHQFTTGNIGFEPQESKGKAFFIGLMAAIVLIPLLLLVGFFAILINLG